MNGSGLPDEASFDYDPVRLADPRQPLQSDLDRIIDDYVSTHPDIKDGDLITIEEPGLSGYTVCEQTDCVQTDPQGNFSLPNKSGASRASIKITDPNADNPALAMRYINDWKGPVTVPAYTKDVDAATMATLTIIPGCDADLAALVCKLDDATLQLRDQHLNDTSIIPIGDGIVIAGGKQNEVGLMQGFLTLPFVQEQVSNPFIFDYFDIIGKRLFDDAGKTTFVNSQDGIMLNYNGKYNQAFSPGTYNGTIPSPGVWDSHTGQDYLIPIGNFIVSGSPTSNVWYLANQDRELRVDIWFVNPDDTSTFYSTDYGHLNIQLVNMDQKVFRGQIVGLSGNSGTYGGGFPQLHFNFQESGQEGWKYIDMYRYTVVLNPLPENFWGSNVSYWTSDNNPQFPRLDSAYK
jgi:hypothetical protein